MKIWYWNGSPVVECDSCHNKVRITADGQYYRHKNVRRANRPYRHNPDCPNSNKKVKNL